jgi:spore maturation protein CgeB
MSKKSRVLYVGPLGPRGTCYQRMRAIADLGYEITPIDTDPIDTKKWQNRLCNWVRRKINGPIDLCGVNARIGRLIQEGAYNVLWVDKGLTVRAETLMRVKELHPGTVIVSYSPDDMLNLDNQSREYLAGVPLYDLHVTTKTYNVGELKELGARDVFFVDNGFCPYTHRPVLVSAGERLRLGGPVGFVGTCERSRASSIAFLAQNGIAVKVWGEWPSIWSIIYGVRSAQVMGRAVFADEYAGAICSFKIALNFLRKINRDLQTTRSVEIPACGVFMLAERTDEHLALFKEGVEAEYFSTNQELLEKVRYYLAHDDERQAIAERGRRRCIDGNYSNQARLAKVFDYLKGNWGVQGGT